MLLEVSQLSYEHLGRVISMAPLSREHDERTAGVLTQIREMDTGLAECHRHLTIDAPIMFENGRNSHPWPASTLVYVFGETRKRAK